MDNLATACQGSGKYAAEALHREALEDRRRVLGAEHPHALQTMRELAEDEYLLGRYAQAESLLNQTLEIARRALEADDTDKASFMDSLAAVLHS